MRFSTGALATFALALTFAIQPMGLAAAPLLDPDPVESADRHVLRLWNFGQIDEGYYRGPQPKGSDYAALAALGIRTVIDLQADGDNFDEEELVRAAGMNFVRIPMTGHVNPTPEQIATFLAIVDDPSMGPVYVHCKVGKHRTGVMTAVYRMERHGWTADQAYKEMKRYGFGWSFLHPEFKSFVFSYPPRGTASVLVDLPEYRVS